MIALANARYTPVFRPTFAALELLVEVAAADRRQRPLSAAVAAAADAVDGLLGAWDDAVAATLFAENVALDEPLERRQAEVDRLRAVHGVLRREGLVLATTTHEAEWRLAGERGHVAVEIQLTPERTPRVQTLAVRSVPDARPDLVARAEAIVAAINDGVVGAALGLDDDAKRRVVAAIPHLRPCALERVVAGDSSVAATFLVRGCEVNVELAITIGEQGEIVDLTLEPV